MPIEVVNIRGVQERPGDVYIGRAGHGLSGKYGNPFTIGRHGSREQVIALFERYLGQHPQLLADLRAENPRRLVCFCAPLACHGDIYAKYLEPDGPPLGS